MARVVLGISVLLVAGTVAAAVGCSLAVDTKQLTAGAEGLDCSSLEKVCPLNLDDPDGPGECVDATDPNNGCSDEDSCRPCEVAGAIARCTSKGLCGISICEEFYENCDKDEANGCEVDIGSDEKNCGACGVECTRQNAVASCVEGECRLVVCTKPYANCDDNLKNGCETNTDESSAHCGGCNSPCAGTCVDGVCM